MGCCCSCCCSRRKSDHTGFNTSDFQDSTHLDDLDTTRPKPPEASEEENDSNIASSAIDSALRFPSPTSRQRRREEEINNEVLSNAGISPPSYEDAMAKASATTAKPQATTAASPPPPQQHPLVAANIGSSFPRRPSADSSVLSTPDLTPPTTANPTLVDETETEYSGHWDPVSRTLVEGGIPPRGEDADESITEMERSERKDMRDRVRAERAARRVERARARERELEGTV